MLFSPLTGVLWLLRAKKVENGQHVCVHAHLRHGWLPVGHHETAKKVLITVDHLKKTVSKNIFGKNSWHMPQNGAKRNKCASAVTLAHL